MKEFDNIIISIKYFIDILQKYYIVTPILKMNTNTYNELKKYISADNLVISINNQAKTHLCGLEIIINDTIPYGSIVICKCK